jgi:hypothetical protein
MPRGEPAIKRIPVTESTKQLIDDRKDNKKTYDLWLREQMNVD